MPSTDNDGISAFGACRQSTRDYPARADELPPDSGGDGSRGQSRERHGKDQTLDVLPVARKGRSRRRVTSGLNGEDDDELMRARTAGNRP